MTDVRIAVGASGAPGSGQWRLAGGGFVAVAGRVVTANHVVRDHPAAGVLVETVDGRKLAVDTIANDDEADVAVLHLRTPEPGGGTMRAARDGDRWVVTAQPLGNDAQLSGTVTTAERRIINDRGHPVPALQLAVDQDLKDFSGYSGGAVRLATTPSVLLGVVCEQLTVRLRSVGVRQRPASNVLYAVPMVRVAESFRLPVPTAGGEAFTAVADLVRADRLTDAERALERLSGAHRNTAVFWYWRARLAYADGHLEAASALADEALKRYARHAGSIALKITILLVRGGAVDRLAAEALAKTGRGVDDRLDRWLECMVEQGMFAPGIHPATEIETRCSLPEDG